MGSEIKQKHTQTNQGANQVLLIISQVRYCPWFNKKHMSMERNVHLFPTVL